MAITKPLRLKREVIQRAPEESTTAKPVAKVWVDNGVYHLDHSFEYLIPDNLDQAVRTGVRIQVPFNGRECEAIVLERTDISSGMKLKPISKVISSVVVASERSLNLVSLVAQRWACHPYDVLRSAIPPRVAAVEKSFVGTELKPFRTESAIREYVQLPAFSDPFKILARFIHKSSGKGSILIIVPDRRSIDRLLRFIPEAIVLASDTDRSARYLNFLNARTEGSQIILGTRSAVFADIPDLTSIIVFNESSEQFFEVRTPGWNARDIAILRARTESVSLYCVGNSPSVEVARLIDIGWLTFRPAREKIRTLSFQQEFSELLPGRIISELRQAAKKGPILFVAPRKGYSQGITCKHCRNISTCTCGARLAKKSASSAISCSLCEQTFSKWVCQYCSGTTPFLINRGTERFAQEIGKALPGVPILLSEAEKMIEDFAIDAGVVIATPGSAPMAINGYAAVVILDGENQLNQSDLRAQERAREMIFSHCALLSSSGVALLVINHANPIVGALASWKPSLISQSELRERAEVELPPYVRSVSLDVAADESATLVRALTKSRQEGRLPERTRILGPSSLENGVHRILLLAPLEDGEALISLIHEFQRRRSSSGKKLASLRIDPYSLSR